jgi:hypothetical protein
VPVKEQIFPKVEEAEEPETLLYEPQAPEGVGPDVVAAQDSLEAAEDGPPEGHTLKTGEATAVGKDPVAKDLLVALESVQDDLQSLEMDEGDLRRQQLQMRADEQEKAQEHKEKAKMKNAATKAKAKAKKEPKPKGRPRKIGDIVREPAAGSTEVPGAEASEPPAKKRRVRGKTAQGHPAAGPAPSAAPPAHEPPANAREPSAPAPPQPPQIRPTAVKAKAKPGPTPRPQPEENVQPEPAWVLQMTSLLVKFNASKPYDRQSETLHKGNFGPFVQTSVYWNRAAVGVKVKRGASWTQICYFTAKNIAVAIFSAAEYATTLAQQGIDSQWWQTREAATLERKLRLSAEAAVQQYSQQYA